VTDVAERLPRMHPMPDLLHPVNNVARRQLGVCNRGGGGTDTENPNKPEESLCHGQQSRTVARARANAFHFSMCPTVKPHRNIKIWV
jgi:hypothetical protein